MAWLTLAYDKLGSVEYHERRIWKHIAFLGRYGHQPADVCLDMAVSDLSKLSSAVAGLLKDEADALKTD